MTATLTTNKSKRKASSGNLFRQVPVSKPMSLKEQIHAAGFTSNGPNTYRHNGFALVLDDEWLVVTEKEAIDTTSANSLANHPGPWRRQPATAQQDQFQNVFDMPMSVLHAAQAVDLGIHDEPPMLAALQWALNTAEGRDHCRNWIAPPHGEIVHHLKKTSLTVQAGAIVRETMIDHGDHHLAFRCPVLTHCPNDLPQVRRDWLNALLQNAQSQWRLVRFVVEEEQGAVIAEVDLTGIPCAFVESFVSVAVDALRWSVSWLAKSAAVIVDASIDSVLLAAAPIQAEPEKGVAHDC